MSETGEPAVAVAQEVKPEAWPAFAGFAGLLVATVVASLPVAFWTLAQVIRERPPRSQAMEALLRAASEPGPLVLGLAITEVTVAAVALGATRLGGRGLAPRLRLGPSALPPALYPVAVLAMLAYGQVLDSSAALIGAHSNTLPMMARAAQAPPVYFALLLLAGGLGAGVAEELFFRGFMQTRLEAAWGRWPAIAATAVCFGFIHMDPVHSPLAALMGVYLGWLASRAGSIRPTMAVHAANNVASFALTRAWPEPLSATTNALLLLGCGLAFVGLAWALRRATPG